MRPRLSVGLLSLVWPIVLVACSAPEAREPCGSWETVSGSLPYGQLRLVRAEHVDPPGSTGIAFEFNPDVPGEVRYEITQPASAPSAHRDTDQVFPVTGRRLSVVLEGVTQDLGESLSEMGGPVRFATPVKTERGASGVRWMLGYDLGSCVRLVPSDDGNLVLLFEPVP